MRGEVSLGGEEGGGEGGKRDLGEGGVESENGELEVGQRCGHARQSMSLGSAVVVYKVFIPIFEALEPAGLVLDARA